jgi:hypothetical protein
MRRFTLPADPMLAVFICGIGGDDRILWVASP